MNLEQAMIGVFLVNWEQAQNLRGVLHEDDFISGQGRKAFSLIIQATNAGEYLDLLIANGLGSYASAAMDNNWLLAAPAMWEHEAKKLAANSRGKRLASQVAKILALPDKTVLLDELTQLITTAQQQRGTGEISDLPAKLLEASLANINDDDRERRLYSGIAPLDDIIHGWRKGNVSVLGAQPSSGKTALALNIVRHNVRQGKRALFFSLEMAGTQLIDRLVADIAALDYGDINGKYLAQRQKDWYRRTAEELLTKDRLYIIDTCYLVEDMAGYIMSIKPDLVVVDFLQFCRTAAKRDNTADRLEYIISEFKRLAKLPYCPCHIMLLSQPSRRATQDINSMFTLKGSSAIEQGGDVIMMLDRPAVRDKNYPFEEAHLEVTKNKFGRTGKAELYFDGAYQRFREIREGDRRTKPEEENNRPHW